MNHNAFISYSSKDKATADITCRVLEGRGVRCWVAPRDIAPGASWSGSIVNAIDACQVMVLVFSGHTNHSKHVESELSIAAARRKTLIPLRIDEAPISPSLDYFISAHQWLDALSPPLEPHLNRLADAILRLPHDRPDPGTPETGENLKVLQEACSRMLSDFNDFWILAGLTDASYEEGVRNSHFRRAVNSYSAAGIPEQLIDQLRKGINNNLKEVLERHNPTLGGVIRNAGKGQDLSFGPWPDGPKAKVEVKLVYDCTLTKYYGSVAEDRVKLARQRSGDFWGDLLLVVFFVQMPKFDYPRGRWSGRIKDSRCRKDRLVWSGIPAQFEELARRLTPRPAWPADGPHIRALTVPSPDVCAAIDRCYQAFQPAMPWTFDPSTHLKDAAVGVAIWQIPATIDDRADRVTVKGDPTQRRQ